MTPSRPESLAALEARWREDADREQLMRYHSGHKVDTLRKCADELAKVREELTKRRIIEDGNIAAVVRQMADLRAQVETLSAQLSDARAALGLERLARVEVAEQVKTLTQERDTYRLNGIREEERANALLKDRDRLRTELEYYISSKGPSDV